MLQVALDFVEMDLEDENIERAMDNIKKIKEQAKHAQKHFTIINKE